MSIYTADLQALYVAYFNRPADPAGLAYWEGVMANGGKLETVAANFANDTEYQKTYAGMDYNHIVNQIYLNLFGRNAEPSGLDYWVDLMNRKLVTIDKAVTAIAAGAQDKAGGFADKTAFTSKVTAATVFTANIDTTEEKLAYGGAAATAFVKTWMAGITDAASLAAATAPAALNSTIDQMVVVADPTSGAVIAAKASFDVAAATTATALAEATAKAAAATTAADAVKTAQATAATAQATADKTDAAALTAASTAAAKASTDAAAAKVAADAAVVTATANFQAAIVAGDPVAVTTANGNLLIAQNNATVAATKATAAAAAADLAAKAAAAAIADDTAAATAQAAVDKAVATAAAAGAAAVAAGDAATKAAAAEATAANTYATAAAATATKVDDAAALAAKAAAAAAATSAADAVAKAAAAKAVTDVIVNEAAGKAAVAAAITALNTAHAAAVADVAAAAAAATATDTAVKAADSLDKANAAIAAAKAESDAAAKAAASAAAEVAAAKAYVDAAAKTAATTDDATAAAAKIAADANLAAANNAVSKAAADVTAAAALPANFVAQVVDLTAGMDTKATGAGADTFNAVLGLTAADTTLTVLDTVDGGAGVDTLNIVDMKGGQLIDPSVTIKNVEVVNVISAKAVGSAGAGNAFDTSVYSGITNVNVTRSIGDDFIKAGSSQAVSVVNTGGDGLAASVNVTGGLSQTVTTAGGVALSGSKGAIKVVDTAQGAWTSTIDNGTSVDLTTTTTSTGGITIGSTAAKSPTGAVNVTENLKGTGALTGGAINVQGGSVDTIVVNATQATVGATTTVGAINVNGTANTTSVSVTQTAAAVASAAIPAVVGVNMADTVTFKALAVGESVTVGGLTFTATTGLTAAKVAAAFANLAAGATQGSSTGGVYSGTFGAYTTGAVSTASLTVTSTAAATGELDVAVASSKVGGGGPAVAGDPGVVQAAAGKTAVDADAGVAGIANGVVTIDDKGNGTITTVSLDAYGTGSKVTSDVLTSLSLANVKAMGATVVNTAATNLSLSLNNVTGASTLDLDNGGASAKYSKLDITASGTSSALNVTATAVKDLTVAGSKSVNLTGSTLSNLTTVKVSGSAGVTLASGANVTDIDTSATSGNNTITNFDASKATFEGGSGADKVTIASATVAKAIATGAGNDTVTLGTATLAAGGAIDGGAGTDTLSIDTANAANVSVTNVFATRVVGFETLQLTTAVAGTVHVDTIGNFHSVITGGSTGALVMDGFASGDTLTLNSAVGVGGSYIVSSNAFTTPTNDVFNVVLSNSGSIAAGQVTIDKVETINVTATDTDTTNGIGNDSVTVVGDSVTAIKVAGNANLTLTSANNTVTSIDGSAMTGNLSYTAQGTKALSISGGAGNDVLKAHAGTTLADVLNGGAGNDTLVANKGLDILTGGAGNDTFHIAEATANVNTYSTVTDFSKGDKLVFGAGSSAFVAAKIVLGATAVFQDYANAAVNAGGDGTLAWFQFNGDTYVVEHLHGAGNDFQNGTDIVVKLTGLVDLSTATLNTGNIGNGGGLGL